MKNPSAKVGGCLLLLLVLLLVAEPALASNVLDTSVSKFGEAAAAFGTKIKGTAISLLFKLAAIQLAVNILLLLLKEIDLNQLLGSVARWILTTGLFYIFITFSGTYLPAILDSFNALGQQGSGLGKLTPSVIITQGIELQNVMLTSFNSATGAGDGGISGMAAGLRNFFPALTMGIISIVIFISFVILSAQMALTVISGYLWMCITPLLLGFGGLSFTKDIAVNSLKGGIAIGMKILCVYLIAGVAGTLAPLMGESMGEVTLTNWAPMYWSLAVSMVFAYLSFQLPKLAADLMNGTASLSAGDAGTNVVMMAAAAASAGAAAGGVGAGIFGAGKAAGAGAQAAAAGTKGLADALGAGYSAASDMGKTGMGGMLSSVGQVASQGIGMATSALGSKVSGQGMGSFADQAKSSVGGRIADKIESGRGGSMGPASSGGAASPSASKLEGFMPSGSGEAGSSGLSSTTTPNGAGIPALPASAASDATGNASTASITGGTTPPQGSTGNRMSLDEKIRQADRFMPQDAHTVGLSANLSSQHHE